QDNGCISTREDPSAPVSAPPPAGAMIPPPPSLPGPPRPGMMPAPHMGGPPMMSMMGPPSARNDDRGTSSWDETTHGRPHAHDARASHDKTSCPPYDGAHPAWHDPARQIRAEALLMVLYFLFCSTRSSWC
ncbi:mCG120852, partial [Mus musculus]